MAAVAARIADLSMASAPKGRGAALRHLWTGVGRQPPSAEEQHVQKLRRLGVIKDELAPPGTRVLRGIWVYVQKERAHTGGQLERSARYAADGSTQRPGEDHGETSCPTVNLTCFFIDEARASQDPTIVREVWDCVGAFYHTRPSRRQYIRPAPGHGTFDKAGRALMCLRCGQPLPRGLLFGDVSRVPSLAKSLRPLPLLP